MILFIRNIINDMKISFGKSGIHIKKQNEGKFTEYCGGKVTQDCINRAKASGNSKLVKRAVFSENAKHWKHQNGGILQQWGKSLKDTYLNIPIELAKAAYNAIAHGDVNYDYKGKFNGGTFNGAGAGGTWTSIKQKQPSNFNEAFDQAVKNKQKTFTFNGLLYNTKQENNPVREANNRIIGEIRSKSKKKDTNYTHTAGPIHIGNLDAVPMVTNKNGGILKGSMGMEAPIDPPDDSFVQLAQKSGSGAQAAPKLKKIYYDAKSNGATEQQAAAATITAAFESHGNYLAKNGKYKGLGQWDPSRYPGGYLNQIKTLLAKNKSQWSRNGYSQFTNPDSTPADTTRVYTKDFIRGGNPTTRAKIASQLFGMTENK